MGEGSCWTFVLDSVNEVKKKLRGIEVGGACLFQQKLVATSTRKFVCVILFENKKFHPPSTRLLKRVLLLVFCCPSERPATWSPVKSPRVLPANRSDFSGEPTIPETDSAR